MKERLKLAQKMVTLFAFIAAPCTFAGYNAAFTYSFPGNIEPTASEFFPCTLVVKNTGTDIWKKDQIFLSPDGNTFKWYEGRMFIQKDVGANNGYYFIFNIKHPTVPGDYAMGWQIYRQISPIQFEKVGAAFSKTVTVRPLPSQFITKLYTEGLGRAPDQAGWQHWHFYFTRKGCTMNTLTAMIKTFLTCTELNNLSYTNKELSLVTYRTTLNRDASTAEMNDGAGLIGSSGIDALINSLTAKGEFTRLCTSILSGDPYSWKPIPGPNGTTLNPPSLNQGTVTDPTCNCILAENATESTLQNEINRIGTNGGTVCMLQGQVIMVNDGIIIPDNVTLKTVGANTILPKQYAKMGRLAKSPRLTAQAQISDARHMVQLEDVNSRLEKIWVDGQRERFPSLIYRYYDSSDRSNVKYDNRVPIFVRGGTVAGCRVSSSYSWTHINLQPCTRDILIDGNLILGYSSGHYAPVGYGKYPNTDIPHDPKFGRQHYMPWTDGISCDASQAVITGNCIIDVTDAGIVVFSTTQNGDDQNSSVTSNTILNAGNSAYLALGFDQGNRDKLEGPYLHDFTSASLENNTLYTGRNAHYEFGIIVGARPWFNNGVDQIRGGTVQNNTSGIDTVNCMISILASDLTSVIIRNNSFNRKRRSTQDATTFSQFTTESSTSNNIANDISRGLSINGARVPPRAENFDVINDLDENNWQGH